MTDDELLVFYRDPHPHVDLETARALRRVSGYRGAKSCGFPGGPADDLGPGRTEGMPTLPLARRYDAGRGPAPTAMTELNMARRYFAARDTSLPTE